MSASLPPTGPPPDPSPAPDEERAAGAAGETGAADAAGDDTAAGPGSGGDEGADSGPRRKPFLLRLPPELMNELRAWSSQELRSLNGHLEFLLRDAVRQRRRAAKKKDPPA